jgi:hypothetical protein
MQAIIEASCSSIPLSSQMATRSAHQYGTMTHGRSGPRPFVQFVRSLSIQKTYSSFTARSVARLVAQPRHWTGSQRPCTVLGVGDKLPSIYSEGVDFIELLHNDLEGLISLLAHANMVQYRRAIVRAAFAGVEGALEVLRQYASMKREVLSVGELVVLSSKTYRINEKGEVNETDQFFSLKQSTKFVFTTCIKAYELNHRIDYGGNEWRAFVKSIEIRNRLMHPKKIADMDVSSDDIGLAHEGTNWVLIQSIKLARMMGEKALAERKRNLWRPELPFLGLDVKRPLDVFSDGESKLHLASSNDGDG